MRTFFLSFLITLVLSCDKKKESVAISSNHYGYQIKLKEKVICTGDKEAYQHLLDIYSDDWNMGDMLSYSLIMANKYDYPQAYYDVFDILSSLPRINANICISDKCAEIGYYCLDDKSKKLAIEYFIQAILKGNQTASDLLVNKFSQNKEYPIEELFNNEEIVKKAKFNLNKNR